MILKVGLVLALIAAYGCQFSMPKKAWNTRFALRTRNYSDLDDVVESLCRDRSLLAVETLAGASGSEVRHVLTALVDKSDHKRFLETLPLVRMVSDGADNDQATDLLMILTSMIKGLKKVRRSIEQGRQLIESSLEILDLPDEYSVLLVLALNITILLNSSGNTEKASGDLLTLQVFSREVLEKRVDSLQDPTELVRILKCGMLRYGPFDNLLRVQSSLLQRSRKQLTYTSNLNGLGLLDGMVRDRRVEMLVLLALERAVERSPPSGLHVEALLEGCRYAAGSASSVYLYKQGCALLDCLQAQECEEKNVAGEAAGCWSHNHYQGAKALVAGRQQTGPSPQLIGSGWGACTTGESGRLLDRAVEGIDSTLDSQSDANLLGAILNPERGYPNPRVLVVGDGDLSFSRALLRMSEALPPEQRFSVIGTVLETREEILSRYTGGEDNVNALCASDRGEVHFQVDCTQLRSSLPSHDYDAFVFNFPFADATSNPDQGFSTRHVAVGRHQELLRAFLESARDVHVSPHDTNSDRNKDITVLVSILAHQAISWDIEQVGLDVGFAITDMFPFHERLYRSLGYRRRRSYSDDTFRQLAPGYATNVVEGWTFVLSLKTD